MKKKFILKKNYEIEKLIYNKKSVGNRFYAIYYNSNSCLKIAFSVSKKYGNAVERNYAKRVSKEIFRKKINYLPCIKGILIIKPLSKELSFLEKQNQINYLINKIKKELQNETQRKN